MPKIQPRVLRGFRDYLPRVMIPRRTMLSRIEQTFERFGFVPLMTPALEYSDVLTGKYGDEGESLLYRFRDQGERDVALRYDLTVPLARVMAQYGDLHLPFRRYQIAPVWRAEKPARGRLREFVQCDGDIVGSADMAADAEILQLACALLDDLGVQNYRIQLNHRKILAALMERAGVASGADEMGVLRTIDKLPKIGREEVEKLLRDENRLSAESIGVIFDFLSIQGESGEILRRLDAYFAGSSAGEEGVADLRRIWEILSAVGIDAFLALDLSIARGLNYYTGVVYEAFLRDLPGFGAVMAGGRYDGLIGVFKGSDVPSVGISLGIDRLLQGLIELKLLHESQSVAKVLVTVFSDELAPEAARVSKILRDGGIGCEMYPGRIKIGKQVRHAERLGMRWVVVVGPDEAARGEVKVKDLESGEQEAVARGEVVEYLRRRLS
jgi:histidyl-tRNA synthetase